MSDLSKLKELASNSVVMLVEDDKDTRESIRKMLSSLFMEVLVACDGKEALQLYTEYTVSKCVDIVITDLSLGELNGVSLIREIKQQNTTQNIIVLSAYEQSDIFIDIIDSGVDSYLLKPISPDKFIHTLQKSLESARVKRISELQRENLENKLLRLSALMESTLSTDTLTGLENEKQMLHSLGLAKNDISLMMIKIDNLVNIKKITGKLYCDFYMQEITALLLEYFANFNKDIKVYRTDFDELAVTLDMSFEHTKIIAEELCALAMHYFVTKDQVTLNSTFTIGAYCGFADDIYYRAIAVFTKALDNRRGSYLVQEEDISKSDSVSANIYWLQKFSQSIEEDMLMPYFQPIMHNTTSEIAKYECLARIEDNIQGTITPDMFLGLTKKIQQTPLLAKIIIRKAFEYFSKQDKRISFSINLTPNDMLDDTIFKQLGYWSNKYDIDPSRVILEILETEDLYTFGSIKARLRLLRENGYKLAIDDFGIGYSNFIYLFEQKVDFIKIDGSFIKNLDTDESMIESVKYINKLIHLTGAKSVAEYVRNENILEIVKEIGIDYSQGYAIGKPQREIIVCE